MYILNFGVPKWSGDFSKRGRS